MNVLSEFLPRRLFKRHGLYSLFLFAALFLALTFPQSVMAGLLDHFTAKPNPLSQINVPRFDERELPEDEQIARNERTEKFLKVGVISNLSAIGVGLIPAPALSMSAEIAQVVIDTGFKFTRAVLYQPADVNVYPDSECGYHLTLPQAKVNYSNPLGLWPKLGDDYLLIRFGVTSSDRFYPRIPLRALGHTLPLINDVDTDFGVLGRPEIYHVNSDVILSVDSPSAGISRDGGLDNGYGEQQVDVPIGTHALEWRAETQYRPVWDTIVPAAMIPIMMSVETKFAEQVKKIKLNELTKVRAGTVELAHTVGDPAAVLKLVKKLDRRIKFTKLVNKALVAAGKKAVGKGVDEVQAVADAIVSSVTTVQRQRNQILTVYDEVPPTLSTNQPQLTFEATDIGGARSSRYLDDIQGDLVFSDNCGRAVELSSDIPERLPLGDTVITWTARDLGPAPPEMDPDGDGRLETTLTQTITIEDTQAPLMVPPPAVVVEGNSSINLNTYDLGQPLVVDLADLHPAVASSTAGDGTIDPGKREIVTWSATDESNNQSTAQQLVTLKLPNTNNPPVADDKTADTKTSLPVDIMLTATDPDVLPFMNGDPGIADPVQFRIEQPPANGGFVAPLLPYFINDYRTDTTGVLSDDLAFALASNQLNWLENEYCGKPTIYPDGIPVNFVFNPLFVHVTDDGEQYFLDHYAVCDPNGTGSPSVEQRMRISRWDKDRNLIGYFDYNPSDGLHTSSFVLDRNGKIYYLLSFGVNEFSLQECNSDFTGHALTNCSNSFNLDSNVSGFTISATKYARVDSSANHSLTDSNPLYM